MTASLVSLALAALAAGTVAAALLALPLHHPPPRRLVPASSDHDGPGDRAPDHRGASTPAHLPTGTTVAAASTRRRHVPSRRHVLGLVTLVATMTLAGPTGPVLLLAGGGALWALRRRAVRRAQRARLAAAVPDAVEILVLTVQAGVVPADAVRRAIPHLPQEVRPAFAAVVHRLDRGQRLADALDALGDHLGAAGHEIADGIAAADRYGLPLAPVLDRLAVDARAARRRLAAEHARTLPVRLSFPLVCCVLPAFVLLAIVPALLGTVTSLRAGLP